MERYKSSRTTETLALTGESVILIGLCFKGEVYLGSWYTFCIEIGFIERSKPGWYPDRRGDSFAGL